MNIPILSQVDVYVKYVKAPSFRLLKGAGYLLLKDFLVGVAAGDTGILYENIRESDDFVGLEIVATYGSNRGKFYATNVITLDQISGKGQGEIMHLVLIPMFENVKDQYESMG